MRKAKKSYKTTNINYLFNDVIDFLPDATFVIDNEKRVVLWNNALEIMTGILSSEMIGKGNYEYTIPFHGEARAKLIDLLFQEDPLISSLYSNMSREGDSITGEIFCPALHGKKGSWISSKASLIRDRDSNIIGAIESIRDISERKQAEAEIAHSHELMSYIIKHSASSVIVLDKDLRYIYANQVDSDEYKPKPEDIIGRYHYDMVPDLPQKWHDVHQRCLKGEIISDDNDPFYRSDGSIDWTKWECRPWYEIDGSIGGIIIYTEIITDRKNAIENLEKSEERFRIMFEEAPLGIGLFDFKSRKAEHINKKFKEIIGRDNEEVLDFDWQKTTHPDDMEESQRFRALMLSGEITGFKTRKRYYKSDGKIIWINITVTLLDSINESNPKEICMIEDISKQIEREEKILYLSNVDSLTDVYNRSFFEIERIRLDVERQLPLSVIVFDIDGLKLINDTFGYSSGDKLLKAAGNIIKKCCRLEDIICRVGGDEFFILLPQTTELESGNICARIQYFAESHEVTLEDSCLKLSLSMGYSTKTLVNEDFSKIIIDAENAMRRKKLLERKSVRSSLMTLIKVTMLEKSHETAEHAERLVNLAEAIGKEINLSDNDMFMLELASSLHDIGKMGIDQQILEKPEKLTVQEWNEIKKHPETGYRIAQATSELMPISKYILAHHERWDGNGYPQGLKGEEIPLLARIISIVDSYDAMIEDRPYSDGMSKKDAISEISKNAGIQFDPVLAKIFIEKVLLG